MKSHRILGRVIGICLLFAASTTGVAQSSPPIRVKLEMRSNETIRADVNSFIRRELRSLKDVEIVEDDPEWTLIILADDVADNPSSVTGFILSAVAVESFPADLFVDLLVSDEKKAMAKVALSTAYRFPMIWLKRGPPESLQSACQKLVAEFDSDILDANRSVRAQYKSLTEGKN